MNYLDFDLLIQREAEGYRVQVLNSPAGQATGKFRTPFSDLEIENLLLRVGRARTGMRRIDSPEVNAAKGFGERLFSAVFEGDVRGCLRSSLDQAGRQGAGLRIRLRMTETPELADLPWEYLYNPTLNRFLALSVETPFVRYLELPEPIRPLAVRPPLRVLVLISSPTDYPRLDVEREWTKLREALADLQQRGLVVLERLEEATLASLQRRLRRGECHILHFIGHGGFNQQTQDGLLILEEESERGRPVSGQDVGMLLHDHRPMRLVVLNACEGARASRTDPFGGTAQSLVQQGLPAVIAMQFEITDEAAITFAHEFYGAVADGYPVDGALAEARKAIFAQGNGLEWGTPVLYLRCPDGVIFNLERAAAQRPAAEAQPPPQENETATKKGTPALTRWQFTGGAILLLILALLAIVWTRGSQQPDKRSLPPNLVSLAVRADKRLIRPQESIALKAKGVYSDGSEQEIAQMVEWQSSDTSVARVSAEGRMEGLAEGKVEIRAMLGGIVSQPLRLSVAAERPKPPPPVQLVSLTVHAAKRQIEPRERVSLQVKGRYSDGKEDEFSQGIQWQSSDRTVGTVNPQGTVTGLKEGSVDITARRGDVVSPPLTLFIKESKLRPLVAVETKRPDAEAAAKNERLKGYIKSAISYREQGNYAAAFLELEKARAADPANTEAQNEMEVTRRACNAEKKLGRAGLAC
jgi:hypothetical protein